jgi:hypothetical protein
VAPTIENKLLAIERYRQIIKQIILEKAELGLSIKEIETQVIIDTEPDQAP